MLEMNNRTEISTFISTIDERRKLATERLDKNSQAKLGQFFTSAEISEFVASLPKLGKKTKIRILDPGAGIGSLSAALIARLIIERPGTEIELSAFEIDTSLHDDLLKTLNECSAMAKSNGCTVESRIFGENFISWSTKVIMTTNKETELDKFDIVITNPPYKKINSDTVERKSLRTIGIEVSNMYAAFVALGVALLADDGQIVAITPRSFTNGPYFLSFRKYFLSVMSFERIHVYDSRKLAFAEDGVLQENIIFSAQKQKSKKLKSVIVSNSSGPSAKVTTRKVFHDDVVSLSDPELIIKIVTTDEDAFLGQIFSSMPIRLRDLSLEVSTGRVVDYRTKANLQNSSGKSNVPLIHPNHLSNGCVVWPGSQNRKPNWISKNSETESLIQKKGNYVLVKRFTAKEEQRRVVAAFLDQSEIRSSTLAFENHLNVIWPKDREFTEEFCIGITAWLNSSVVDRFIRSFSGHTQINASDLRRIPFPTEPELNALGKGLKQLDSKQQTNIDNLVQKHVKQLKK